MAYVVRGDPTELASAKETRLVAWLRAQDAIAIGFSGGVDSAYLAAVAVETLRAENVLGIIGRSASYPEAQWQTARAAAAKMGLPVLELDTDELNDPHYAANPANRCYFCKTELWSRLVPAARERGILTVVDGTNADDLADYRPGARAAAEHGVRSPLAECGLTKSEIRALSRTRDLPTADLPSSPCLASRIPYGMPVTATRLRHIEMAEAALRDIGIVGDLRVRHHGTIARVELAPDELDRWIEPARAERLARAVRGCGYERVVLDLAGFRSGSLNILTGVTAE